MFVLVIWSVFHGHLTAQKIPYCVWNRKLSCLTDRSCFILNLLNPINSLTLSPKRYSSLIIFCFTCGATTLLGSKPPHCWGFEITHTNRHTAIGRTPLDEGSTRRRQIYLTTHNIHKRQASMTQAVFEPVLSPSERTRSRSHGDRPLLVFVFLCSHRIRKCSCTQLF